MPKETKTSLKDNWPRLAALTAVVFIVFMAIFAKYALSNKNSDGGLIQEAAQTASEKPAPLSSKNAAQSQEKTDGVSDATDSSSQMSDKPKLKSIDPVIVYAGVFGNNLEISAYAPTVEKAGTCIATIIKNDGTVKVTRETPSSPTAKTMDCAVISIPASSLDPGVYEVTVTYESSAYLGTSKPVEVTVP